MFNGFLFTPFYSHNTQNFITVHIASTLLTSGTDINIVSEEFKNDSIAVSLELLRVENSTISASFEPQAQHILNLDPRHILLSLSYNTAYSVTTTVTLCGQNASHAIKLYYGKIM